MTEHGKSHIIVVLEDDPVIGALVAEVLREAGYRAEWVRDVTAARQAAASGLRPAGILSDLIVAGSAGPASLAGEIEAMFPGVPLALMTGVPSQRREVMGVTHARVVEKPFELEELLGAVRAMVGT